MPGMTWEEFVPGLSIETARRTLTEWDLMQFVTLGGFVEPLFFDEDAGPSDRRLIPAALTFTLAEGLVIMSGIISGTGIAFLGAEMTVHRPVFVGDTIRVSIQVLEARPTREGGRGIVRTRNVVLRADEEVLSYEVTRMVRGSCPPGS